MKIAHELTDGETLESVSKVRSIRLTDEVWELTKRVGNQSRPKLHRGQVIETAVLKLCGK